MQMDRKNPASESRIFTGTLTLWKKRCGTFPFRISPLWPCAPDDDLHVNGRWGAALDVFAAPNIHPTSKRGREVCNPTEKSSIPMI